jgi:hypothetical protein
MAVFQFNRYLLIGKNQHGYGSQYSHLFINSRIFFLNFQIVENQFIIVENSIKIFSCVFCCFFVRSFGMNMFLLLMLFSSIEMVNTRFMKEQAISLVTERRSNGLILLLPCLVYRLLRYTHHNDLLWFLCDVIAIDL